MLQIDSLVQTANEEAAQLAAAKEDLVTKNQQLADARAAVETAQSEVDSAQAMVTTETSETVSAYRAIMQAIQLEIDKIQPTPPAS